MILLEKGDPGHGYHPEAYHLPNLTGASVPTGAKYRQKERENVAVM